MDDEDLLSLGTATLAESGARPMAAGAVGPMWPGAACAGPARTVRCAPGDNLAIHVALLGVRAGEVLVVQVEGVADRGYWGEVLTTSAQGRGVAGLVIDACVRDTQGLEARRFPVFAAGTALPGATKGGPGAVGDPVTIGEVEVRPGDVVVADADGVVVVTAVELDRVRSAARARFVREQVLFALLAGGASTVELLDLTDIGAVSVSEGSR